MLNFWRPFLARFVVVGMVLAAMLPGVSFAQDDGNSYTYEDLDVTVEWSDQWTLGLNDSGIIGLSSQQALNAIISVVPAASFTLEEAVFLVSGTDQSEILEDNSSDDPASILFRFDGDLTHGLSYAYYVNDGEAIVMITLTTAPSLLSGGIDIANEGITVNGDPILGFLDDSSTGSTEAGSPVVDATPADESTRTTRSSRGSSSGQVTPEATEETEEATTEATVGTRSSRGNTAGQTTPEATEEVTAEATEESTTGSRNSRPNTAGQSTTNEGSLEDGVYVSENWQYQISWDTELWQLAEEDSDNADSNGITLTNGSSLLIVTGTDIYGSDPAACLAGENAYYGTESASITGWDFALDANGDPLTHEGADLVWGVFSYTFTSSDGNEVSFVDYISCETIPGQDGLLMVHLISVEEMYNTNLDLTLDILDTLEFQP